MATLNTVFKEVFSEGLKDEGFVKIKGRQPYIVRVVNGEILHIITCRNEWCGEKGYKSFAVFCEMATVYRPVINLTKTPNQNISMLTQLLGIWNKLKLLDNYNSTDRPPYKFAYRVKDDASLYQQVVKALEEVRRILIPLFDRVNDLNSFYEYHQVFFHGGPPLDYIEREDCFKFDMDTRYEEVDFTENLLVIKIGRHDNMSAYYRKWLEMELRLVECADYYEDKELEKKDREVAMEKRRLTVISQRDKIYDNPKAYAKALELLEENRRRNLELLRSYGLKV